MGTKHWEEMGKESQRGGAARKGGLEWHTARGGRESKRESEKGGEILQLKEARVQD